ncbi:hypothetical protein QA641_14135 [Bradyrhizobium sp. CB1650]|uniref:DUF6894 family protein n=1 Tax=Bradyrhizobium sp. CB1650 TaxID=3039153 RepID=UPI002435A15B|nr:hypothetical protein [Bradyrhizobium sp. CB1650]WGD54949.1 hypothetical protein QA641_14135 [Bradyrhizobium sp. CB1650]
MSQMPHFFFDIHDDSGRSIDNEGCDLPDMSAAKQWALECLGESILDGASRHLTGRFEVIVRSDTGLVLRVSASVEVGEDKNGLST